MILICTQTDKNGFAPEYGPLFEALDGIAAALQKKPAGNVPVVVFESTLAPSSMLTVVRPLFAKYGLEDGRDMLLGNTPNRVMPGRLVERVARADKLAGGLHPGTPQLIARIYARIVTGGIVYRTNSLTAEIVKTLENAYRDVRIAYAAEVARYCDAHDIDFFALRDKVNAKIARGDDASADPRAVPSGALLVPTVGVGGHCLPKDGILLWWRAIEAKERHLEEPDPGVAHDQRRIARGRRSRSRSARFGSLAESASRCSASPTASTPRTRATRRRSCSRARCSIEARTWCSTIPYVHERDQNLAKTKLTSRFTTDLGAALEGADVIFLCTAHGYYQEHRAQIEKASASGIVDACNLFDPRHAERHAQPLHRHWARPKGAVGRAGRRGGEGLSRGGDGSRERALDAHRLPQRALRDGRIQSRHPGRGAPTRGDVYDGLRHCASGCGCGAPCRRGLRISTRGHGTHIAFNVQIDRCTREGNDESART